MKTLIIDVSAAPFRDYVRLYGRLDGILCGCWYRIARPAMVATMWLLFGLYVYHSLVMVGGTASELAELIVYVAVVAHMAAALITWMVVCRFHNWIRLHDRSAAGVAAIEPAQDLRWLVPVGLRQVEVRHDDKGRIAQVSPWPQSIVSHPAQPEEVQAPWVPQPLPAALPGATAPAPALAV